MIAAMTSRDALFMLGQGALVVGVAALCLAWVLWCGTEPDDLEPAGPSEQPARIRLVARPYDWSLDGD